MASDVHADAKMKTSRRGRPSAARASAIDRGIISMAREHFLAEGYDAVSMEQIALAAGISKGTLYARHPSKEALFVAVIDTLVGEWSDAASSSDDQLTPDIGQRLHYHALTIAEALHKPDVIAFQKLLLSMQDRFPELTRAMHDRGYRYIVDVITRDIIDCATLDARPVRDPASVARIIVAAISGCQIQEGISSAQLGAFAQRVVDLVMAARDAW